MVQVQHPGRGLFPLRDTNWKSNEKPIQDGCHGENRANGTEIHSRSLTIEQALKDCVGLDLKDFALITIDENGQDKIYTSTSLKKYQPNIFTRRFRGNFSDFSRGIEKSTSNLVRTQNGTFSETDNKDDWSCRPSPIGGSSSETLPRSRGRRFKAEASDEPETKRHRLKRTLRQRASEEILTPIKIHQTHQLRINDDVEVKNFYAEMFRGMQQNACKIVGKAWIRLVEPRKQTNYPYSGGLPSAPRWWPRDCETGQIPHREPDHLLKSPRVALLVHILQLVVEPPEKQHEAIQQLRVTVKKLEEVTTECLAEWFRDSEHPRNAQKQPFVKELFKVAKQHARLKMGAIDPDTVVPVMCPDRTDMDSDDDEEEEMEDVKYESKEIVVPNIATTEPFIPPAPMASQPDESKNISLGVRQHITMNYRPQIEDHSGPYNDGSSYFNRQLAMPFNTQPQPSMQEPPRRFQSTYPNHHQHNLFNWNNNFINNTSMDSSYYTPQTLVSLPNSIYQPAPPPIQLPAPTPLMTQPHYDGLPQRSIYDTAPALGQLRTGSLSHPHQMHPQQHQHGGYQEFLDDPFGQQQGHVHQEVKDEQVHVRQDLFMRDHASA